MLAPCSGVCHIVSCRWENYDPNKKWDKYSTGESGIVRDEKSGKMLEFKPGQEPGLQVKNKKLA